MKVTGLRIKNYRQLASLEFDFTYPAGHPHAGQPLRKICIIGQSATGKTTILEIIKHSIKQLSTVEIANGSDIFSGYYLDYKGAVELEWKGRTVIASNDKIVMGKTVFCTTNNSGGTIEQPFSEGLKVLYFSSEVIAKNVVEIFNQNPLNIGNEIAVEKYSTLKQKFKERSYVHEFSQELNEELWFALLYEILDYRKRFTQMASELISKGSIGDLTRMHKEVSKWSEQNINPLLSFAEFFNPILKKLNLEVDTVNTEYPVPIRSINSEEVLPIADLSTGTKGLLLSMFPLHRFDTKDAIILIDEAERSLFPDVQIELMNHFQNLAPEAQIIVATHSPFIAAAFEPDERFILYFDTEGKVALRRGESPIGDDPNDMLRNDFNVDYYNEFGKRAYAQYRVLKQQVSQETEPQKKKALLHQLAALGDKYNFAE